MSAVKVDRKVQVAIPRAIRKALGIRPGQKLQVIRYGNRTELIALDSFGRREATSEASTRASSEIRIAYERRRLFRTARVRRRWAKCGLAPAI